MLSVVFVLDILKQTHILLRFIKELAAMRRRAQDSAYAANPDKQKKAAAAAFLN
ncbi:hypothetical protein [Collimonas silvisoli]|uniref:hypothetical protein n=1 Tax=Collimonas silvisoli TaxID=2825884 RepID=UPI001B8D7ADF|nr:hypothetical protein [Collimonas silvisoli]